MAEDVEKVDPALVVRDADGKVNTVRHEAVNAMLLNEFLKAHRRIEAQEATIGELKSLVAKQEATAIGQRQEQKKAVSAIAALTARVEEQAAQMQKVSAQIRRNRAAPELTASNQ